MHESELRLLTAGVHDQVKQADKLLALLRGRTVLTRHQDMVATAVERWRNYLTGVQGPTDARTLSEIGVELARAMAEWKAALRFPE
jgi:hypothetical protein